MRVHVASVAVLVVALLASLGVGARWYTYGYFDPIHAAFALFFSINLLICYWEACLFLRRDYIESRAEHWRERQRETGRIPAFEFLATKIAVARVLSPTIWAVVAVNSPWVLFPLLGLYVSVRLIVDGEYRVMGL